jgi:hypothetical protein
MLEQAAEAAEISVDEAVHNTVNTYHEKVEQG